jgi:phenylacetate-CoA ligase
VTTTTSATTTSSPAERLRALAGEQLARDGWSRDRLLDHQGERLRALIAHAVAASPYYRKVLGPDAASGDVPLPELPTLPKATLMDNFDRIVTDPRLRRADLEAHLSGPGADRPYLGRYKLFTTAGTTGVRGLFVEHVDEFAVWSATCLRGVASWGLSPATRLAGIGSPSPLHISNQAYAVLLGGQASPAPRLAVTTPLPEMVQALNAFQPEALNAYPSVAAALAEEQLQGRLRIAPALVATSSEVQTADMRRRMTDAWGVEPLNFYGTTEALILAAGRPGQAGMDILEDLVVVEVVDQRDRPVPPGVPGHKVLVTSLVGRVQPLLRYELTDSVTLAGGPNPLGLPYARIAAVDGLRAQRRRRHPPGGRWRAGRGPPVPAAGAVLRAARGPPVPGRPRAGRAPGEGRPARHGPGGHPGPGPRRPGPRAPRRRRGPAPDRGQGRSQDRPRPRPRRQVQAHQEHHGARLSSA